MDRVSVIIPTYNYVKYLPETLDSVFRQTHKNLEVIVVDDGSTDNTEEFIKSYPHPITYIKKENQGLAEARNTGIRAATSDLLAFLDADDLWEPEKIRLQLDALQRDPSASLVYTQVRFIDGEGQPLDKTWKWTCFEGRVFEQLFENNFIPVSSVLIRKACVDQVGMFDKRLKGCEDYDYWLRTCFSHSVKFVNQQLLIYRVHSSNMSKDDFLMSYTVVKTLEFVLEHPEKRSLLKGVIKNRMAPLYEDLGMSYYYRNDYPNARTYLWKSIRVKSGSIRKICYVLLCLLPSGLISGLRKFLKSLLKKSA